MSCETCNGDGFYYEEEQGRRGVIESKEKVCSECCDHEYDPDYNWRCGLCDAFPEGA